MPRIFPDRAEAGRRLAQRVKALVEGPCLVAALPRGGVPVAFEVAKALGAPLDVLMVRKLGVPGQEELAFGAIASGEQRFVDADLARSLNLTPEEIRTAVEREEKELRRRESLYRAAGAPAAFSGRTVVLVDDGMATGATMRVAVQAARGRGAARVVVAVPVSSRQACQACAAEADDCVCLEVPERFRAVSEWYHDFEQVSDAEVRRLVRSSASSESSADSR